MIETVIFSYLKNDSTLSGLLGASASNPKIYPYTIGQNKTAPYLSYYLATDLNTDITHTAEIVISCHAATYPAMVAISDRVKALLDKQDALQSEANISDATYKIFSGVVTGTIDTLDDLEQYERRLTFLFNYVKK